MKQQSAGRHVAPLSILTASQPALTPLCFMSSGEASNIINKGNNKITELRTILQRESPNS